MYKEVKCPCCGGKYRGKNSIGTTVCTDSNCRCLKFSFKTKDSEEKGGDKL